MTIDNLIGLPVMLQARLPGIYARLAGCSVDWLEARNVAREADVLDDVLAVQAEALTLACLALVVSAAVQGGGLGEYGVRVRACLRR